MERNWQIGDYFVIEEYYDGHIFAIYRIVSFEPCTSDKGFEGDITIIEVEDGYLYGYEKHNLEQFAKYITEEEVMLRLLTR